MESRNWTWVGLIAVVAGSALIPAILFGEPRRIVDQTGGDPWRNIIFDFQTLFTGMAAVAAATWTVFTMERTDARQERRHRELVRLSLRSDRLLVERMLHPAVDLLPDYLTDMRRYLAAIEGKDDLQLYNEYKTIGRRFTQDIFEFEAKLSGKGFDDARYLFSADAEYYYLRIIGTLNELKAIQGNIDRGTIISTMGVEVDQSEFLRLQLRNLIAETQSLYDAFQEMAVEYRS